MRNNGFEVDAERNILRRMNDVNKKSKVYIDLLISELDKNETSAKDIVSDIIMMFGASIGFPRMIYQDHTIDIDGRKMVIPKYTIVHQNTYYIHRYLDWNDTGKVHKEENNCVHLEYWLDDDGKFKMNDHLLSFVVGARGCIGQSVAMKALYAMFGLTGTSVLVIVTCRNCYFVD